jgi:hypothetical protein
LNSYNLQNQKHSGLSPRRRYGANRYISGSITSPSPSRLASSISRHRSRVCASNVLAASSESATTPIHNGFPAGDVASQPPQCLETNCRFPF